MVICLIWGLRPVKMISQSLAEPSISGGEAEDPREKQPDHPQAELSRLTLLRKHAYVICCNLSRLKKRQFSDEKL